MSKKLKTCSKITIIRLLDFTLQAEKALKKARHRKEQFKKQRDPRSCGAKRIKECHVSKITNGLDMLKRAVKQGFRAKYVLADSWFSSHKLIETVRGVQNFSYKIREIKLIEDGKEVLCLTIRDVKKLFLLHIVY